MSKTLLALGIITLLGSLMIKKQSEQLDFTQKYEAFKQKFGKRYPPSEDDYRKAVYIQNTLYAESINLQEGRNVFGETIFFDLTNEEFTEIYLTLKITEENFKVQRGPTKNIKVSDHIDWTEKGAVTEVKDQGQCGASQIFGATGVLEGFFFITTGELPNLSNQQLLDCTSRFFDCNGGLPADPLDYAKRNGITTENDYPYTASKGGCKIKGGPYHFNNKVQLEATEEALISYLNIQPVSVAVNASYWQYYNPDIQKIFNNCNKNLNHAVLAVGYDKDSIKIKNSWGMKWGDRGYIYLARGENTCGVNDYGVVVV